MPQPNKVLKLESKRAKAKQSFKTGLDQETRFSEYEIVNVLAGIFQKKTTAKWAEAIYLSSMFIYNIS